MTESQPKATVAIVGGATAGAEVAARLAERGIQVVVFNQNAKPFGKIEDGLPRWHEGLRNKEYANIQKKLSLPLVEFVPNTRIGEDIAFSDLVQEWGFTSVVLANGAWRDRPLPIEGSERYINKGLVYQNPFVIAFNHQDDSSWSGEIPEIIDGSIVVGGGLASIDVAKIVTLTCTQRALAERNIHVDIVKLEIKGIPKTLAAHDLNWEELGLEGCTIYYRRRLEDMPLIEIPGDADEARVEKIRKSRLTMLNKASEKFKLKVEPLSAPDELLIENESVAGIRFRRTQIEGKRVISTDETYERRGPVVLSSIGSIPEPIEGISMKGELIDYSDWDYGRLEDYPTVFSVGNIVTGKGNIVASRKHASSVSQQAIEVYLGIADEEEGQDGPPLAADSFTEELAASVSEHAQGQPPISEAGYESLMNRVTRRQQEVSYTGSLDSWLQGLTAS